LRLFWALKWHVRNECHLGPKKSRFLGPTPSNAPSNDVAPLKTIKYSISAIKTTGTLVVLCTQVLLLCVVVCKRGGEVSLQQCCVRRYSGGGGWLAGLPLPLPLKCRYRVFTEFRRHRIPSVYSVFRAELVKIPAEFRRIPCRIQWARKVYAAALA
jgi:hypothetical protein